jgi:hypothetical protein
VVRRYERLAPETHERLGLARHDVGLSNHE